MLVSDPLFSAMGRRLSEPVITDLMKRVIDDPGLLSLAAGFTDTHTLPATEVGRAVEAVLAREGPPDVLQYGSNQGRTVLRRLIAERVFSNEGGAAGGIGVEDVAITNGSQQALYLAIQTLCDPGDVILVEDPTYFVFLEMLRGMGVQAIALPSTPDGAPDLNQLTDFQKELKARGLWSKVKAFYTVSYFSNPSSRSLTSKEKNALGEWLAGSGHPVALIEDAAYRALWFEQAHQAPSALHFEWASTLPVLYLGTLDKPFASGLKVGFMAANHRFWLERMLYAKGHQDFGSAHFAQAVAEEVILRGDYDRHLEMLRPHYAGKAAAMGQALAATRLEKMGWQWNFPTGGLYFWLRGPEGVDSRMGGALAQAALERQVIYVPGDLCHADGNGHHTIRLSFGAMQVALIPEAVQRLASAIEDTG